MWSVSLVCAFGWQIPLRQITHKWLKLRTDDINFVLNNITENTKTNGKTIFNKEIYPLPILFIYTDAMMHAIATTESVYPGIQLTEKLIPATNPNAFEVYFKGTNHMSVTDLPLVSPFLVNIICGTHYTTFRRTSKVTGFLGRSSEQT